MTFCTECGSSETDDCGYTDNDDCCTCDDDSSNRLSFTIQKQQQPDWCWIAVAVSVDHFLNGSATSTQCQLYTQMATCNLLTPRQGSGYLASNGLSTCCGYADNAAPAPCDQEGTLWDSLHGVSHYGDYTATCVDFPTIEDNIDAGYPLCMHISWWGGDAHFVVIVGYSCVDGVPHIDVADPATGMINTFSLCDFQSDMEAWWDETYATA